MSEPHAPLPPGLFEALLDPSLDAIWQKLLAPLSDEANSDPFVHLVEGAYIRARDSASIEPVNTDLDGRG